MKKDFVFTFLTQLTVLLSGLLVFKLAMVQFGDTGFAQFSLAKRNLAYLYTLIMLGLGVAVPRYIANEIGQNSGNENNVFLSAILIMAISLLITGTVLVLFRENISLLLFGERTYTNFLFPIFISITGLSFHSMIYSYYRGKMYFNHSNLLQVINMGFIPIIAFFFAEDVKELFLYTGLIVLSISLSILIPLYLSKSFEYKTIPIYIPKLLNYGFKRVPADFGLASLLALPAIFSAHTDGPLIAGYVAFSISLLSLSGQAVAPIGLIMLPKISHLLGKGEFSKIKNHVKKLMMFALLISVFGTSVYHLFAKEILSLYLGNVDPQLVEISKTVMYGVLFYPVYVTLRSIVDAYYEYPYNTTSILIALTIFLTFTMFFQNVTHTFIVALSTLALMTLYFIKPLLLWRTS